MVTTTTIILQQGKHAKMAWAFFPAQTGSFPHTFLHVSNDMPVFPHSTSEGHIHSDLVHASSSKTSQNESNLSFLSAHLCFFALLSLHLAYWSLIIAVFVFITFPIQL